MLRFNYAERKNKMQTICTKMEVRVSEAVPGYPERTSRRTRRRLAHRDERRRSARPPLPLNQERVAELAK